MTYNASVIPTLHRSVKNDFFFLYSEKQFFHLDA